MCKQLAISPEYYLAALSVVAIAPLLTPQGQDFFHKLERAEIGIISLGILLIAIHFLCLAIQQTRVGVLIVFVYGLLFVFPYLGNL